ncbi:MAG: DUF3426 domain-containing protein [Steroidobacteraceae bacterium]
MLTQCPNCQTTFRVTTEILRVADGQVRCGRCQTQFDALERLIDENEAADAQAGRASRERGATALSRGQPRDIEVEEPAAQEDITLEGRHIEISGRYRLPDGARGEPRMREETVEEWVEIDDIEDAAEEAHVIEVDEALLDGEVADDAVAQSGIEVAEEVYEPEQAQEEPEPEMELLARPPRAPVPRVWKILLGPLVLLLAIQFVHTYRHSLARNPQLGRAIVGIYGAFGANLQPDWNLHAYEILQWHLGSDPALPGTLKVRANLKNAASFAQPYPLLKLVLEDRWGDRVREREFEPAEYLDPSTAPDRLLGPAQQATATISIVDPGPDAEGFRFDVCLRGSRGIVCAADVPQRK